MDPGAGLRRGPGDGRVPTPAPVLLPGLPHDRTHPLPAGRRRVRPVLVPGHGRDRARHGRLDPGHALRHRAGVVERRAADTRPSPGGRGVPGPHPPPRLVRGRRRLVRADPRNPGVLVRDGSHQPVGPGLSAGRGGTSREPAGAPGPARRLRGGRLSLRLAPDPPSGLPRGRVPPGPGRPARPDPGPGPVARAGPAAALSEPGGARGAVHAPLETDLDTGRARRGICMLHGHPSRPRPLCRQGTRRLSLHLAERNRDRLARLLPERDRRQPVFEPANTCSCPSTSGRSWRARTSPSR